MATGVNPYQRQNQDYNEGYLPLYNHILDQDGGNQLDTVPIFITKHGEIIANRFIDKDDDFHLRLNNFGDVESVQEHDAFTTKYTKLNGTPSYTVSGLITHGGTPNVWKTYSNSIVPYSNLDKQRFQFLNKFTKKQVENSTQAGPFCWHFTHDNGKKYPVPEIKGTWFAPFNYDTYIRPTQLLKGTQDVLVIKSGEFEQLPESPSKSMISLLFNGSSSGSLYIYTHSLPDDISNDLIDSSIKGFKIPRSGHANRTSGTSEEVPVGPIGVFKNGVIAYSYKTTEPSNSYLGAGNYNHNMYAVSYKDACNGQAIEVESLASGSVPEKTYVYRAAPTCLYDTGNSTAHSPLLGYAIDGYPIYGPYGYTSAMDSSSTPKLMTPSYRLKPLASRPNGPPYGGSYSSGVFLEDYEYVNGLGDLDEFNGRICKTPEYPTGTYAYFTTVTTGSNGIHTPAFPYIIGDKFYGKVEKQNWTGIEWEADMDVVLKSPTNSGVDVDLYASSIYGLKYQKRGGLKKETILFASPHQILGFNAVRLETGNHQYMGTGGLNATFSGNLFSGAGNLSASGKSNKFMALKTMFYHPTSKNVVLKNRTPLSGNMPYQIVNPDTNVWTDGTGSASVTGTSFYLIYSGYRSGMANEHFLISPKKYKNPLFYEGVWDGKIPSGTPFKIEVWSFNGVYQGLENTLDIYPCEYHPALPSGKSISAGGMYSGFGSTVSNAVSDLRLTAKKDARKQMNSFFVASGIMEPNKKIKKYSQMIRRETI